MVAIQVPTSITLYPSKIHAVSAVSDIITTQHGPWYEKSFWPTHLKWLLGAQQPIAKQQGFPRGSQHNSCEGPCGGDGDSADPKAKSEHVEMPSR